MREILGPEEALRWRREAWEKGAEARKARREAQETARNKPKTPLRMSAERHYITKVRANSIVKKINSVVEPWVDVKADVEAINVGKARRDGEFYHINGRIYTVHNGRAVPVSGDGVHQLDRGAYKALMIYNSMGLTPEAEARLDAEKIRPDQRAAAKEAHLAGKKSND
ncbi:MAG TPA: hypothetical protein PLH36_01845 [Armatimonadota bacterium]|nr:hypothetical protein [Armatimonadota bacterium]